MRRSLTASLALAAASSWPGAPVFAGENDFRLNGLGGDGQGILFSQMGPQSFVADQGRFRDFATQLGFVLAPRLASPAETLGYAGFHVGAMWSGSLVSNDQPYWLLTEKGQQIVQGGRGGRPSRLLHTLQLDVRKGLPFSFEIGTNFMWLAESELFAPGLEVRWALQEGFRYIPDLSVRGAVNHLVGSRDMFLTTVGLDAVLSKSFGLLGMVNIAPYVGWSLIFIAATSRVIDPTPTVVDDINSNIVFDELDPLDALNHKLTLGTRILYSVLNLSVQGELQVLSRYRSGGSGVSTITTKLGLDF